MSINIMALVGGGLLLFMLVMGGIFWYYSRTKGSGKKIPFLLYNREGTLAKKLNAKIKVAKDNKSKKVFVFEENDTELPIQNPSLFIDGVGYRQVTYGNRGEFVYVHAGGIDDNDYLSSVMSGEDVAVFTGMILENNREFENPMAKTTAALIIGMAMVALIIMIGTIYSTITLVGNSKDMASIAKENSKTISGLQSTTETLSLIAEQNAQITAALTGNENLTRRLE